MRIGLKLALIRSGLSQREVSRRSGIPEVRLSNISRGWSNPRPEEQAELERLLGVGADDFVKEAALMRPTLATALAADACA
jgi:transcriptional regulator with XRE-family HTH domain